MIKTFLFGESRGLLPIWGHDFGTVGPRVLLLGGVHGDEPEGFWTTHKLLQNFTESWEFPIQLTLVPILNPDGAYSKSRTNFSGVDLNRNLDTKDWSPHIAKPRYHPGPRALSEPENQALKKWILKHAPKLIISMHSWEPCLNINGDCAEIAQAMAKVNGYRVTPDIGYPTPGSLGTYGTENGIPVITYEIQKDLPQDQVLAIHPKAVLAGLEQFTKKMGL